MNKPSQNNLQLPKITITGTSSKRTIFTAGHSNLSAETLQALLKAYKIDRVIDVRTKPYSRWCPQFNKNQLAYDLAKIDINYDWRGFSIGGLGENVDYEKTIRWVYEQSEYENIVLLCSERDYHRCHRYTMLTPSLEELGAELVHIGYN